jgi:hypothetical protein
MKRYILTYKAVLGAFAKLRLATISFFFSVLPSVSLPVRSSVCLSVRQPGWKNSAPTEWIFTKFDFGIFFRKPVEKIQVSLNSDKSNGYSI